MHVHRPMAPVSRRLRATWYQRSTSYECAETRTMHRRPRCRLHRRLHRRPHRLLLIRSPEAQLFRSRPISCIAGQMSMIILFNIDLTDDYATNTKRVMAEPGYARRVMSS